MPNLKVVKPVIYDDVGGHDPWQVPPPALNFGQFFALAAEHGQQLDGFNLYHPPKVEDSPNETLSRILRRNSPESSFSTQKGEPPYSVIDFSHVGIEVEMENIEFPMDEFKYWVRKQDGSLRNNGWEFVSYPIKGVDIAFAIHELKKKIEEHNHPEFSGRTSVHIHLNILDMTKDQLRSLIILYLCFERILYNFVSPHRYKNIFCTPISQAGFGKLVNTILFEDTIPNIKHWMKYTGFNLAPVRNLGTVEFRHMKGTLNPENIVTWINIIQKLKIKAMEIPFEQLAKEIAELNTNSHYDMVLFKVFGKDMRHLQTEFLHKLMEQDVLFVKETLTKYKNPKYDKHKFVTSLLGQYILRKGNLVDYSVLEKDFSKYTLKEVQEYKAIVLDLYKKAETARFKDRAAEVFTQLNNLEIVLSQKQKEMKIQKPAIPKAPKKIAIPKGAF